MLNLFYVIPSIHQGRPFRSAVRGDIIVSVDRKSSVLVPRGHTATDLDWLMNHTASAVTPACSVKKQVGKHQHFGVVEGFSSCNPLLAIPNEMRSIMEIIQ